VCSVTTSTDSRPSLPEIRDRIVADLSRDLPGVPTADLTVEVDHELEQFADAPVKQYLPVLVGRAVKQHHR
jgi:hypothetical protein